MWYRAGGWSAHKDKADRRRDGHIWYRKEVEDGSILILCEAEQAGVDALMRRIRDAAEPVVIEDMRVEGTSPATGISGFVVELGDIQHEMLATMSTRVKILLTINKTLNEMKETQNEMKECRNFHRRQNG